MRKVYFEYGSEEFRVDGEDIEEIIKYHELDKPLETDRERFALLGLMYLEMVSEQGGGAGDMPLFTAHESLVQTKINLLEPAFGMIYSYYKEKNSTE